MKERRKISGSCLALAMIVLASSAALAQSSSDSAPKNRESGMPDNPVTSNQPIRQQQKEGDSSRTPTEGKKPKGSTASKTTAPKDSDKASSGKKIPLGSGGGGVTGAVGR